MEVQGAMQVLECRDLKHPVSATGCIKSCCKELKVHVQPRAVSCIELVCAADADKEAVSSYRSALEQAPDYPAAASEDIMILFS